MYVLASRVLSYESLWLGRTARRPDGDLGVENMLANIMELEAVTVKSWAQLVPHGGYS